MTPRSLPLSLILLAAVLDCRAPEPPGRSPIPWVAWLERASEVQSKVAGRPVAFTADAPLGVYQGSLLTRFPDAAAFGAQVAEGLRASGPWARAPKGSLRVEILSLDASLRPQRPRGEVVDVKTLPAPAVTAELRFRILDDRDVPLLEGRVVDWLDDTLRLKALVAFLHWPEPPSQAVSPREAACLKVLGDLSLFLQGDGRQLDRTILPLPSTADPAPSGPPLS